MIRTSGGCERRKGLGGRLQDVREEGECDRPADRPTYRPTDRPTDLCEEGGCDVPIVHRPLVDAVYEVGAPVLDLGVTAKVGEARAEHGWWTEVVGMLWRPPPDLTRAEG